MKIIKLGLISIVFFAIFLTILSFFFPSHVRISKAMDIRASKDSILIFKNSMNDPEIQWNIMEATVPNTVTVQWYMDFHQRWYPWEKFSSLLLEKRYGPVLEKGLSDLKKRAEK